MFSVSSGDTQLYPSPLLAGLRINVGFDIILTWLATWQAVKAWSPVIITYQFSPKRCWSISFYCLSTKRITKPGQRLVTSNHHLSKMFSIHSSQRPVSSEINSFAIKKNGTLVYAREANSNVTLTKSCEDPFNSDKTVAESDLMGQLNT